jgi:magnesium transporter
MREVVNQAADNDNIATIYVIDEDGTFLGAIDLKDLIIAREGTELSSIILTSYPYVYAYEQIDNCIERIKDYSEDSIPVLDADNKLQGVLISQDITELVEEEMGEDYAKLAGLSSEEDLEEPLKKSIGKRLPWLVVLLGLGLVVSSVVGIFEGVVSHIAIIVSFQSLILGMAGNVGTQSLAVTIRVLMDEELGLKQKLFLIGKEARIGLINGVILGLLSFVLIGLYLLLFKGQAPMYAFAVSACTALALLVAILLSSLSGTIIPIIFKRIKIDPAVASGPLITTINDLVAVVAYYGLAWVLLINVLGL